MSNESCQKFRKLLERLVSWLCALWPWRSCDTTVLHPSNADTTLAICLHMHHEICFMIYLKCCGLLDKSNIHNQNVWGIWWHRRCWFSRVLWAILFSQARWLWDMRWMCLFNISVHAPHPVPQKKECLKLHLGNLTDFLKKTIVRIHHIEGCSAGICMGKPQHCTG